MFKAEGVSITILTYGLDERYHVHLAVPLLFLLAPPLSLSFLLFAGEPAVLLELDAVAGEPIFLLELEPETTRAVPLAAGLLPLAASLVSLSSLRSVL